MLYFQRFGMYRFFIWSASEKLWCLLLNLMKPETLSTCSSHWAHVGTVLRASSIYSRPSLVGRHIGTTYVTWSAVDKMADVNTPVHSAHLGTFGSPRKFPFRALTSHSAHLGSFRSVHEARSRLQFRGVPNARRSSCRHIWSADTVASVKQIL